MDPREQLSHILPELTDLVARIEPSQLDGPTPCTQFTVRDVLDHMTTLGGMFAHLFRGEAPPMATPPERTEDVPVAEFRKAMDDLLDAVRSDGAMERILGTALGVLPGETFARFVAFDGVVHGWDLATSTGLPFDLPTEVVAAVDDFARTALRPEMRDGDTFAEATTPPDGADAIERLAAFSGRAV